MIQPKAYTTATHQEGAYRIQNTQNTTVGMGGNVWKLVALIPLAQHPLPPAGVLRDSRWVRQTSRKICRTAPHFGLERALSNLELFYNNYPTATGNFFIGFIIS